MRLLRFACLSLIFLAIVAVPTRAEINMEDVVGLWLFDEGDGEVVNDLSGNENHGTFNGTPEWAEGVFGEAVNCSTGGHVLIKDSDSLDLDEAWTLTLWVNINPPMERWQTILNKRFDTETNYVIRLQNTGAWEVLINNGGWVRVGDPSPAQGEQWVHLAAVYDGADTLSLFVNGEQVASRSGIALPPANDIDLRLGSYSGSGGGIDGMIDETAIFNAALEPDDIMLIKEEGLAVALDLSGARLGQARSPSPKKGALHEATWINLSWKPGESAVSHDVYFGDDFGQVEQATRDSDVFRGNQTAPFYVAGFPGFALPDGLVAGTTYYWRIDEVNDTDPNSPWKGDVWNFMIPPKIAYSPDPVDGAEFVDLDAKFRWTPGFGAVLNTFYIGTDYAEVDSASGGVPQGPASYDPGTLELEKVYYWRIDSFEPPNTHKGDIWSFTTPGAVGNSQPANGAVDVSMLATLGWAPADTAASSDLYFGADADAVYNAATTSPEYIGNKARGSESYDPGKLALDSAYHWRVDAVYPDKTVKGLVWSFTSSAFVGLEDFESYNDFDPPDPNSNRMFDKWIDGFGTTTNGALVGNDFPPYAEQTVVHGGDQSMIYRYDNAGMTSEATLTLVYPRDWTEEGVAKLSLWHRGASANAPDRMYVALNGTSVVYHEDPAATNITGWRKWVIDLSAFGVNLTNVNSITIGIGTQGSPAAGGTGTMYFDDIRLVR